MFRGLRLAMGRVDPDSPEVFREVIAYKPAIGNPRLIRYAPYCRVRETTE